MCFLLQETPSISDSTPINKEIHTLKLVRNLDLAEINTKNFELPLHAKVSSVSVKKLFSSTVDYLSFPDQTLKKQIILYRPIMGKKAHVC